LSILVRAGKTCHLRGFAWESGDTEFSVPVTANVSGQTRIDLVVLRLTRAAYTVTIEVRAGVPGAGAPPAPVQQYTEPGVYEIVLGTVTVLHNATAISASQAVSTAWLVDDDGNLSAYSTNRPPAAVGRQCWEIDTSRLMLCTGTTWIVHWDDTGWLACTPTSNTSYGFETSIDGFAEARRLNGVVTVRLRLYLTGQDLVPGKYACCDLPPSPDPSDPTRGFAPPAYPHTWGGVTGYGADPAQYEVWPSGGPVLVGAANGLVVGQPVATVVSYPVG
uniref:hypothetical protein n=1 Tax=Salinispora arenicola TaxID=168697 RepID=UPI000576DA26